jgi:hypothetical protein
LTPFAVTTAPFVVTTECLIFFVVSDLFVNDRFLLECQKTLNFLKMVDEKIKLDKKCHTREKLNTQQLCAPPVRLSSRAMLELKSLVLEFFEDKFTRKG